MTELFGQEIEIGRGFASDKKCPRCQKPVADCSCRKKSSRPVGNGNVRVSRETKGRKGKGVTLITGLPLNQEEIKDLGKELRQKCGCGGTVKDGVIEIQGDHRDKLVELLTKSGFKAKRSGG